MTLTYREGRPEEEMTAVFLQAELAEYGINVELEKIQTSACLSDALPRLSPPGWMATHLMPQILNT